MNENEEYKVFKQLLHAFYQNDYDKEETESQVRGTHNIKIEPTIIYDTFEKSLKVEFKIGDKQLYKLKSLPEFYDRMLKNEIYRYGNKLNFIHNEDAFEEKSLPLLRYILKYSEIIKYANETTKGVYGKYGRTLSDEYITISNSGLDELFEVLEGTRIIVKKDYIDKSILFVR